VPHTRDSELEEVCHKIAQKAVVELLNAIYEQDFLDCSYGFRPGRGAQQALDEVGRAICRESKCSSKVIGGSKPKGEVFVAFDVAKARNAVSIAEGGRDGEVRYFGEIDNTFEATRKLILKLASRNQSLTVRYEARPTGYGLYR
jgi:hypothetical protein